MVYSVITLEHTLPYELKNESLLEPIRQTQKYSYELSGVLLVFDTTDERFVWFIFRMSLKLGCSFCSVLISTTLDFVSCKSQRRFQKSMH